MQNTQETTVKNICLRWLSHKFGYIPLHIVIVGHNEPLRLVVFHCVIVLPKDVCSNSNIKPAILNPTRELPMKVYDGFSSSAVKLTGAADYVPKHRS